MNNNREKGMHWAERHVNPLLVLRNNVLKDRWTEGWQAVVSYRQQQRWKVRRQKRQKPVEEPPTTHPDANRIT